MAVQPTYPGLDRVTSCPRLELSALDHDFQHRGDLAFFAIEYVKHLTQLVPPALDFITNVKETESAYYKRQKRDFLVHLPTSMKKKFNWLE
jgi:hypothetical protein